MARRYDSYGRPGRGGVQQPAHLRYQAPGGPGGYAPFGGSLYEGGGTEYDMSPSPGDWTGPTTGAGDLTVPGHEGDDYPGQDTWGELLYRREARDESAPPGRGPHAGRGPRRWRRADERIHEDVCEALTRHPAIDASAMEVQVEAGEVTLSGEVDARPVRRMAEDVAAAISGVRDVHNRLRVRRAALGSAEGTTGTTAEA